MEDVGIEAGGIRITIRIRIRKGIRSKRALAALGKPGKRKEE